MRCFEHMNREALASCVSCGKGVCLDCLSKHQGKIFCEGCMPADAGDPFAQPGMPGAGQNPFQDMTQAYTHQVQAQAQAQAQAQVQNSLQASLQRQLALSGLEDRVTIRQRSSSGLQGVPMSPGNGMATIVSDKDRFIAALLAFVLGTFGVHKFYLGQIGWGIIYCVFSWTMIPSLAGLIEGVLYLARPQEDFVRRYGKPMLASGPQNVLLSGPDLRPSTPKDYERYLLRFAQRHGGQISMVHLMAEANLRQDRVEDALARLAAKGLVQSELDAQGHLKYYVPEFRDDD